MFKVRGFAQSDMLERFSNYLNKILKSRWDAFTHRKYNSFIAMQRAADQELSFYERMKIDEIMRHHKAGDEMDDNDASPLRDEDLVLEEELAALEAIELPKLTRAEKKRKAQLKQIKKMAVSLGLAISKAKIIYEITESKNVRAKSLEDETEDEEMFITPAMAQAALEAEKEMREQ